MSQNTDGIWKRNEVESPCTKVCVIHPKTRLCTGCFRSIDEITAWSKMTPEVRREIMAELPARGAEMDAELKTRRGGRAARLKRDN